jgi:hypothetical protein
MSTSPISASATPRRARGKSQKNLALIQAAYEVARDCHPITVRGIAYKLFSLGFIASMAKRETDKVSTQLKDARELGVIPWDWIVDETREAERINTWSSTDQIIRTAVETYRRDYWLDQPHWVEVWSEKGTIRGILRPILNQYGVTFRVMHGYGSATAIHDIAEETTRADKPLTILYVGDWDPSGMNMSEVDIPQRISRYNGSATISRIALLESDTAALPSFEAETKQADSRYRWFVTRYGHQCWELDAMDPNDLRDRVERQINSLIDTPAWNRAIEVEAAEVESMQEFYAAWETSISRQAPKYSGMDGNSQ